MPEDLPDLYFRLRPGGATVFRVSKKGSEQNLAMVPVAAVKLPSGTVRVRGQHVLSAAEEARIADWIAARGGADEDDPVERAIHAMNLAADWAEKTDPDEALARRDALLLAIHDLRGVIVRQMAARVDQGAE